jgi:cephalosporin hydroxylase
LSKDGEDVSMRTGISEFDGQLPFLQLKPDVKSNIPNLFEKYKPKYVVDNGTFCGGVSLYLYGLMKNYCEPKILSIDITDEYFKSYTEFHERAKSKEKIIFILNKSDLDCKEEILNFLKNRKPDEPALFYFDSQNNYQHTYQELLFISQIARKGDVILMNGGWNQDLCGFEKAPLFSIYKFLKNNPEFALDEEYCRNVILPCRFIYGVMIKK